MGRIAGQKSECHKPKREKREHNIVSNSIKSNAKIPNSNFPNVIFPNVIIMQNCPEKFN